MNEDFKTQIYYWEIFSGYLSDFPKIRENKSREKYLLFLTAKINPREKILFPSDRENKSPRKEIISFCKIEKKNVNCQTSYTIRSCDVSLPI